jgi:hypothetical protein
MSEENIFDPKNVPESNWFKMEKVGDKVSGLLVENPYKKVDNSGQFGDQRVFVMQQTDGTTINFGIRVDKDYLMQRTNKLRAGDKVGFEFVKEIPAQKKGYSPAKSIEVYAIFTEEGDRAREFEKDPSKF